MAIFKVKYSCGELWLKKIYAHDQLLCNVDGKTCSCTEWNEKEQCYKISNLNGCKKEEEKLKKGK